MSEHRRIEDLIRRHLGKRERSYPERPVVVDGDYEMTVKYLDDALTKHEELVLAEMMDEIANYQQRLSTYRQIVSTMLGILDELDTANGWIVIRDSARAALGRPEIHVKP